MKKKFYPNRLTERMQKNKELNRVKTHQETEMILALYADESEESNMFTNFFNDVLKTLPKKTATIILASFDKSKQQAEQLLAQSKAQYETIFDEFLVGVD